jgi:hypothetical protein
MDDECIVCFNKVKCDSALDIFDKKCECEYIIHDECLKKWLATSPTCIICHSILLINPYIETIPAVSSMPPRTESEIDVLFNEINEIAERIERGETGENDVALTNAEAIQHINQAKKRLYICLFIIMGIIIFSYRI